MHIFTPGIPRSVLALLALSFAAPAAADTLIDNVNGVTLDEAGHVVRFSGLVIGNDGKVVRLMTASSPPAEPARKVKKGQAAAEPYRPDYRIDGKGRTMLPGLIDAHGHVMGLGFQALTLDLSDTNSLAEAQARLAAYARDHANRRWIIGRGWNQERWGLGRFPTAAELDAVVADKPVWLERVDGHAGWANSAAMAEAGITAKSVSPSGGRIELAGGQPSGIFVDAAMKLIDAAVPRPLSRERDQALIKAQDALLAFGITGIADMGTSLEDWSSYRRAGDGGWLNIRIFSYSDGLDPILVIGGNTPTPWLYGDKLRMGGVKLYADGALGSRGAWLKAPYADAPNTRGLPRMTDTQLGNLMSRAAMDAAIVSRELQVVPAHGLHVFQVLGCQPHHGNVEDVDVGLADQVEQQVEGAFEGVEEDLQRLRRDVQIPRQLEDRLPVQAADDALHRLGRGRQIEDRGGGRVRHGRSGQRHTAWPTASRGAAPCPVVSASRPLTGS